QTVFPGRFRHIPIWTHKHVQHHGKSNHVLFPTNWTHTTRKFQRSRSSCCICRSTGLHHHRNCCQTQWENKIRLVIGRSECLHPRRTCRFSVHGRLRGSIFR